MGRRICLTADSSEAVIDLQRELFRRVAEQVVRGRAEQPALVAAFLEQVEVAGPADRKSVV